MINFEEEIIIHGKQLSRMEETLLGIQNSIKKLEVDPANYVSVKVFIFTASVISASLGYLFLR